MNKYQLFESLCRSMTEASAAMSVFGPTQPGAKDLIQYLHTNKSYPLAHDQPFRNVEKISWNDFKQTWPYNFAIVAGPTGTAAIISEHGDYKVILSDGANPLREIFADTANKAMALIKSGIGGTPAKWQFYVGAPDWKRAQERGSRGSWQQPGVAKELRRTREKNKPIPSSMTISGLYKKFRPTFAKAVTAAIADTKGMVSTMIKNDAFEKAKQKLDKVHKLDELLQKIVSGGDYSRDDTLMDAVQGAVIMTAAHFYPELTGTVGRGWGGRLTPQNNEGIDRILAEIGQGDVQKLATVLAFFKRKLIA